MRLLLLVLLCSSLITGCSHEADPLRIGSNRWLGYAPFYLADEFGWATSANIRLVEYSTSNGVIRGMHNGLLDAALLTLDEAITLQSTGHDIEIILVTNISAGADVLYTPTDVRHTSELKGKRIAVEGGTLGAYFLSRILTKAALESGDIKVINLPTYMHPEALKQGSADASINHLAMHAQFDKAGMIPLFTSRDLDGEIIDVLVVNRERINTDLRSRIRELWFNSLDTWLDHRESSDQRLYRRLGLDKQALELTLNGMIMGDRALNTLYFEKKLLAASIEQMQNYMLKSGMLEEPIDIGKLLPSCVGDSC